MVISVRPTDEKKLFEYDINILNRVSAKEIAMVSRQIATLLEAHVPALKTFRLFENESENITASKKFTEKSDEIYYGVTKFD